MDGLKFGKANICQALFNKKGVDVKRRSEMTPFRALGVAGSSSGSSE
jgi:hypothetical protein